MNSVTPGTRIILMHSRQLAKLSLAYNIYVKSGNVSSKMFNFELIISHYRASNAIVFRKKNASMLKIHRTRNVAFLSEKIKESK